MMSSDRSRHDDAYAPDSASSSDHSDRGTHSHHSSSRRVLAHVLARKERDSNQMHQLLKLTFAKLDEETQRATDAERRATECLVRARTAIDSRAQADADAAAARAELTLYKMQLEQAQREISRAQELLDGLETRRHDAEQDAARARSVARKLQEERSIEAAREQGKQQGWHEGIREGIRLGRREAENELRSRHRREEEADDRRSRSRPRRHDALFTTQVVPPSPQQSASERSSPDADHDMGPIAPVPSVPIRATPFRRSPEQLDFSIVAARRHEQQYDSEPSSPSPPQSRSRPRLETPVPELARSRPYTPHDDSTPSIIQPIPIPASGSSIGPIPLPPSPNASPVRHPSVRIPPDNWIPRAQDHTGDGRLSIFLPPPHELVEPVGVPEGPYDIAATPEDGSPAVVPPPPILPPSPGPSYAATPPPPELGPAVRAPTASRSRDYVYAATPPPPDLARSRDYDYAAASLHPPPPPDLAPAGSSGSVNEEHRAYLPPQRIAQIASNHSRTSTHLSEFDLLAPVDQPRNPPSNIGPPPAEEEEEELEYIDNDTQRVPIPRRRPIAAPEQQQQPILQRGRGTHGKRPFRGPSRPRNIVLPAPLSQATTQLAAPSQPLYMPPQPQRQRQRRDVDVEVKDEDAPLQATATSSRPQRTHTQSSIGISVEPPSPENSPPYKTQQHQRRFDLLSPEHAESPLPMPKREHYVMPLRNKPQPPPPLPIQIQFAQDDRPLTPLPELALAGLAPGFAPENAASTGGRGGGRNRHAQHAYDAYEVAPVPAGIEYPASPLQAGAPAPLSPLTVPSGFLGFKNRLPWRRK